MFTDGLDTSALQWVRKEQARNASTPASAAASPDITRGYKYPLRLATSKGRGLPPPQLSHVHIHSDLLRHPYSDCTTNNTDDLEESVGSISAGNPTQDDYESGEEQDSGVYSPPGSSPGDNLRHSRTTAATEVDDNENVLQEAKKRNGSFVKSEQLEVGDYYDRHLPLSRRESFGKRDSFGRKDDKGRNESFEGKENLDRRDSFALSGIRQGEYAGSGRYGSEKRDDVQEKNGFIDTSVPDDDGDMTSETELSEDEDGSHVELDDDEEEEEDEDDEEDEAAGWVPYRTSIEATAASLELPADSGVEKETTLSEIEPPTQTQSPTRRWLSEPDNDDQLRVSLKDEVRVLRRSHSDGIAGPPSAPPMLDSMVLEPADLSPATPTYSAHTAFSYDTMATLHSAPAKRETSIRSVSTMVTEDVGVSSRHTASSLPLATPVFLSGQAAWQSVLAYDACVRLCLRAWSRGSTEAPEFLQDECALLRDCFGLTQILLQPHEEGSRRPASGEVEVAASAKPKLTSGKVKVQVRKIRIIPNKPIIRGNSSAQRSMAYVNAGAQYMRQVSGILKEKVNSLRHNTTVETPHAENFTCVTKLKSSTEDEAVRIQPGSSETTVFLPESSGDDLLLEIIDSKGSIQGRLAVPISSISDDPNDRVRWYGIYNGPDNECVGKVQLFLHYTTMSSENSTKWGPVGETRAYDIVLDVAMRVQQFHRRNLRLQGSWIWLLAEFASCYGVKESYTKLRYLACVMEVATPTEDCLMLIDDLLRPIIKARDENSLDRQEKRILVEVEEQVEQLLALVFENYKALDEASPTGLAATFTPAMGSVAPALVPAVQIFTLMHDILSVEAQSTLRNHFKTGVKMRCKRHMMETEEYVSNNSEGFLMDPLSMSTAYQKMKVLCLNISSEVRTDIEIHNKHVLPSSIDLPNIAAGIYNVELANRLRAFLVACPPSSPTLPVTQLMLATADFQRDLVSWGIRGHKGGVDAKELFHLYVVLWIQEKRLNLLDFCKFDKERCTWVTTQHSTSPFVEEVYERIKETLNEYEIIIHRWPEYIFPLEHAMAEVERAVVGALEKQYADLLAPLKDLLVPKKFTLQYMQKLTRRQKPYIYSVPSQLGVMLNSIKRLLDTLRPNLETQMKAWAACLPEGHGGAVFGERLNEVTIELRAKYKNFLQAIVEKLADNARLQRTTKLKSILQDTREAGGASDIRERMQPLTTQLEDTISHLHDVFTPRVFVAVCRGYWDRMARDVLQFLDNRKENRLWYKGSTIALGILDDVFASQMQKLQGRALQEKDLEPPRSVAEARSMLSRDTRNGADSFY